MDLAPLVSSAFNSRIKTIINRNEGPALVSKSLIVDPSKLQIRGVLNNKVVQDCGTEYVFSVEYVMFRSLC